MQAKLIIYKIKPIDADVAERPKNPKRLNQNRNSAMVDLVIGINQKRVILQAR